MGCVAEGCRAMPDGAVYIICSVIFKLLPAFFDRVELMVVVRASLNVLYLDTIF